MSRHPSEVPLWERSKENAAPLERGRNVTVLERSFARTESSSSDVKGSSDPSGYHEPQLQALLDHYERLVQPTEEEDYDIPDKHVSTNDAYADDPLIHWLSYIKFHQDTFPSDTHQEFLLLERCFRSMIKLKHRYANDVRFLRVCCLYAEKTTRAMEIFQFLYQQKVGIDVAMFWAAWAWKAEKDKDYAFAEKIYTKAISKESQPMELLKQRQKQFQRRMSRHFLNASMQRGDDQEDEEEDAPRGALEAISEEAVRRNDRSSSHRTTVTLPGSRMATFAERRQQQRLHQQDSENILSGNTAFPIYVEGGADENSASRFDDSVFVESSGRSNLETEEERNMENRLAAERWNDRGGLYSSGYAAYRQSNASTIDRPAPAFLVFVDEECEQLHQREEDERRRYEEQHRRGRDERTFRDRHDGGAAERLANDPLRYVRDRSMLGADHRVDHPEQAPAREVKSVTSKSSKKECNKQAHNKIEAGYNCRLLKNSRGEEQSFEQARANAQYFTIASASINLNLFRLCGNHDSSEMSVDEESMESIENVSMGEGSNIKLTVNSSACGSVNLPPMPQTSKRCSHPCPRPAMLTARALSSLDESFDALTPRNTSAASSTVDESAAVGLPMKKEEQTINTQLALKELSMMFSSPATAAADNDKAADQSGIFSTMLDRSRLPNMEEERDTADLDDIAEILGRNGAVGSYTTETAAHPPARGSFPRSQCRSTATQRLSAYSENDHGSEQQLPVKKGRKSVGFAIHCDDDDEKADLPNILLTKDAPERFTPSLEPQTEVGSAFTVFVDEEEERENLKLTGQGTGFAAYLQSNEAKLHIGQQFNSFKIYQKIARDPPPDANDDESENGTVELLGSTLRELGLQNPSDSETAVFDLESDDFDVCK